MKVVCFWKMKENEKECVTFKKREHNKWDLIFFSEKCESFPNNYSNCFNESLNTMWKITSFKKNFLKV